MNERHENVHQLPVVRRSCFDCTHVAFGFMGQTICGLHREVIDSELFAASDCEDYER